MVYKMVRGLTPESTRIKHPHPHSRGSPSDHFRNRLALVTTAFVKTPFKIWLKRCDEKLSQATATTFGITQLDFFFVFKLS